MRQDILRDAQNMTMLESVYSSQGLKVPVTNFSTGVGGNTKSNKLLGTVSTNGRLNTISAHGSEEYDIS